MIYSSWIFSFFIKGIFFIEWKQIPDHFRARSWPMRWSTMLESQVWTVRSSSSTSSYLKRKNLVNQWRGIKLACLIVIIKYLVTFRQFRLNGHRFVWLPLFTLPPPQVMWLPLFTSPPLLGDVDETAVYNLAVFRRDLMFQELVWLATKQRWLSINPQNWHLLTVAFKIIIS